MFNRDVCKNREGDMGGYQRYFFCCKWSKDSTAKNEISRLYKQQKMTMVITMVSYYKKLKTFWKNFTRCKCLDHEDEGPPKTITSPIT